jgi:hypothetical protein
MGLDILSDPGGRDQQALCEQLNVENVPPVARLVDGQEVEQQCGKTIVPQGLGNEIVARAKAAAAAAMREQYDPLGTDRQTQLTFEANRGDRNRTHSFPRRFFAHEPASSQFAGSDDC